MTTHGIIYKLVEEEIERVSKMRYGGDTVVGMGLILDELLQKIQELEAQSKGYQIKPLEWSKIRIDYPGYVGPKNAYFWHAPRYIVDKGRKGWKICGVPLSKLESSTYYKTEDEAKSICEKNYEETVKLNLI